MLEQSCKVLFSTESYNHGFLLLRGAHPIKKRWVPEIQPSSDSSLDMECTAESWASTIGLRPPHTGGLILCWAAHRPNYFKRHDWLVRKLGKESRIHLQCVLSGFQLLEQNQRAMITSPAIQNMCDGLCKKTDERQIGKGRFLKNQSFAKSTKKQLNGTISRSPCGTDCLSV